MLPPLCQTILEAVTRADQLGDTASAAFTVMPDHVHWLFQLGARLSLGRVIGRFKAETLAVLGDAGLRWQRDFFERRLRPEEISENFGRYMFLNLYRAGLLDLKAAWPGWWCADSKQLEFLSQLNPDGSVPNEWIPLGDDGDLEKIRAAWD